MKTSVYEINRKINHFFCLYINITTYICTIAMKRQLKKTKMNNLTNDWGTYTKGDCLTYEYTNSNGRVTTETSRIDYILNNRYYSLFVLENGHEQVSYSKLYLSLSK